VLLKRERFQLIVEQDLAKRLLAASGGGHEFLRGFTILGGLPTTNAAASQQARQQQFGALGLPDAQRMLFAALFSR
jgi:hypothetical protein